jgi:oxygen-independent coproporphyrinogen-3 oxidase
LEREIVDLENRNIEKVMLELRLASGMDLEWLKANGFASAKGVSELIADGLIDGVLAVSGRLVLTAKGRLLADAVIRKVLNF